jgi:microcompartment protein CcmK/EutM
MILARVVGTVVSSHKPKKLDGIPFLLVEKIDPVTMKGKGDFVVAMDSVGAGLNEIIFYVSGSSARFTPATEGVPTDCSIVAIVDFIEKNGTFTYRKDSTENG